MQSLSHGGALQCTSLPSGGLHSVVFRIPRLHHVDKVREHFLLLDRDLLKVLHDGLQGDRTKATTRLERDHSVVSQTIATHLRQLRLVETLSGRDLVVAFVPPQRIHLQLHQVHLRHGHRRRRRGRRFAIDRVQLRGFRVHVRLVAVVLTVFAASPFRAHTLDAVLVVVTDVRMPG